MKYLRKFENYYVPESPDKYYWCVPTGNKLKVALMKIGTPQKYIDKFIKIDYTYPYIYVGQYNSPDTWGWDRNHTHFKSAHSIYKGKIEVDESEISADKYNL